jgi:hypothetical protein
MIQRLFSTKSTPPTSPSMATTLTGSMTPTTPTTPTGSTIPTTPAALTEPTTPTGLVKVQVQHPPRVVANTSGSLKYVTMNTTGMAPNELILQKHVNGVLDGMQNVSAGFYGKNTRANVIEATKKLASTADKTCAHIEKRLDEAMALSVALKAKHDDMDAQVADIVQAGEKLQSFLDDLNL